jgi:hypothetical protein
MAECAPTIQYYWHDVSGGHEAVVIRLARENTA